VDAQSNNKQGTVGGSLGWILYLFVDDDSIQHTAYSIDSSCLLRSLRTVLAMRCKTTVANELPRPRNSGFPTLARVVSDNSESGMSRLAVEKASVHPPSTVWPFIKRTELTANPTKKIRAHTTSHTHHLADLLHSSSVAVAHQVQLQHDIPSYTSLLLLLLSLLRQSKAYPLLPLHISSRQTILKRVTKTHRVARMKSISVLTIMALLPVLLRAFAPQRRAAFSASALFAEKQIPMTLLSGFLGSGKVRV
jgi:hypothetical protein